jgi:hypothetical protein
MWGLVKIGLDASRPYPVPEKIFAFTHCFPLAPPQFFFVPGMLALSFSGSHQR